jgi:hypothetical protein
MAKLGTRGRVSLWSKSRLKADILIVHVDLTCVPDEYLEFAQKFPVVLNGQIKDVSKRSFSSLAIQTDSDYKGEVIVKTNANYAGWPEKTLQMNLVEPGYAKLKAKLGISDKALSNQTDYRVYNTINDVPEC